VIEGALHIVDGISDNGGEVLQDLAFLDACKFALDVFKSTVSVYMSRSNQSFFQAVNARLKFRNVMVGPFDLETCTFAGRHISNSD
jgi:hypothetical protein